MNDLYVVGWRQGYLRGFRAAMQQMAREVDARAHGALNVPFLDAEQDSERYQASLLARAEEPSKAPSRGRSEAPRES